MMLTRLLVDENVPLRVMKKLLESGYNVRRVETRSKDDYILSEAEVEGRILITFDRDFGQLIYEKGLFSKQGIIYFRLDGFSPENMADFVDNAIKSDEDLKGYFTVITKIKIRKIKL
jgi:predicted nuclease of predicted toxin-antitoxin system